MIRFVDLTSAYFPCGAGQLHAWAFINTTSDTFLETESGSHLFDWDDIKEHPQADRLRQLMPLYP
jgi:hypothetical protein